MQHLESKIELLPKGQGTLNSLTKYLQSGHSMEQYQQLQIIEQAGLGTEAEGFFIARAILSSKQELHHSSAIGAWLTGKFTSYDFIRGTVIKKRQLRNFLKGVKAASHDDPETEESLITYFAHSSNHFSNKERTNGILPKGKEAERAHQLGTFLTPLQTTKEVEEDKSSSLVFEILKKENSWLRESDLNPVKNPIIAATLRDLRAFENTFYIDQLRLQRLEEELGREFLSISPEARDLYIAAKNYTAFVTFSATINGMQNLQEQDREHLVTQALDNWEQLLGNIREREIAHIRLEQSLFGKIIFSPRAQTRFFLPSETEFKGIAFREGTSVNFAAQHPSYTFYPFPSDILNFTADRYHHERYHITKPPHSNYPYEEISAEYLSKSLWQPSLSDWIPAREAPYWINLNDLSPGGAAIMEEMHIQLREWVAKLPLRKQQQIRDPLGYGPSVIDRALYLMLINRQTSGVISTPSLPTGFIPFPYFYDSLLVPPYHTFDKKLAKYTDQEFQALLGRQGYWEI